MARILLKELTDVDWQSALRFLTREEVPKDIEENAVAAFNDDIDRSEREEAERFQEWRRLTQQSRSHLRESRRASLTDEQLSEAKTVVRQAVQKWPGFDPFEYAVEKVEPSIAVGSLEATLVPPYDFFSTQQIVSGPAEVNSEARKTDGFIFCDVKCPEDGDESNGVARGAVGIFFQPVIGGTVKFGAHPSFIYFWYTLCFNADSRSRGAMGLRAYRFKLDGTVDPSPPDDGHKYFVTTDWEQWYNNGCQEEPHSGTLSPWLSIEFDVSQDRFYNLWFYARVNANADGGGIFYDSAARAEMNGIVPKLKWKFVT